MTKKKIIKSLKDVKTIQEFMDFTHVRDESTLLEMILIGYKEWKRVNE